MKKSYLIGIDIGTSACKVAVFDREGRVLAAANGAYPVYYPHEGWAEQNPEEWWSAVCQATEETIQKNDLLEPQPPGTLDKRTDFRSFSVREILAFRLR